MSGCGDFVQFWLSWTFLASWDMYSVRDFFWEVNVIDSIDDATGETIAEVPGESTERRIVVN